MADWVKILVSAIVGMVAGIMSSLISEPLKARFVRRSAAKRARKAIYQELGRLYLVFVILSEETFEDLKDYRISILKELKLDAYEFYYNQQREAFYQIAEWTAIKQVADSLSSMKSKAVTEGTDLDELIADVTFQFMGDFQYNGINRDALLRCARESAEVWERNWGIELQNKPALYQRPAKPHTRHTTNP